MPVCSVLVKSVGGNGGAIFTLFPLGKRTKASFVSGKSEISNACPDSIDSKDFCPLCSKNQFCKL